MSKQYKKLQQKLHPKEKKTAPKEKPVGKDYLLLAVIAFIIVMTAFGWDYMNNISRAMYILLGISMSCNYVQRHAKISEEKMVYVARVGLVTIGIAVALFLVSLYYQFAA
ncbi:MAG: hypothetical protein IJU00_01445 [Selenomonas sp.]|uniref:hypothetical protein n=1 Tax=Selenomonas sp. AB3002 TaxID=1392502 RepID=UPI00049619BE|nr:hypothetical protein [Selenomonas sp.]